MGFLLAHNLTSPYFRREPKARVTTNDMKDMEDMEHHGENESHELALEFTFASSCHMKKCICLFISWENAWGISH